MKEIRFFVPGEPKAKGRARSRYVNQKNGKGFIQHYTPAKTKRNEDIIRAEALRAMGARPATKAPVHLIVDCLFSNKDNWPAWKDKAALDGLLLPTMKPDLDNIIKSVKDAINGVIWVDDSQVVSMVCSKAFVSSGAGIMVRITEVKAMRHDVPNQAEYDRQFEKLFGQNQLSIGS